MKKNLFIGVSICSSIIVKAQLSPLTIGTIQAGDSIVIKYNATINTPLVPLSTTQISNQGTIAGINFASLLTDDPDSGPAGDATITLLNVFPLPVHFVSVKAYQQSAGIRIEWITTAEIGADRYEVEKSTDGRQFTVIGSLPARSNGSNSNTIYSYFDANAAAGNNYYRIKSIDLNPGIVKYTSIVNVNVGAAKNIFTVTPNPLQNNTLNLQLQRTEKDTYTLSLYNSLGQKVTARTIDHPGGSSSHAIYLGNIPKGVYQLRIENRNSVQTKKLIVQ